MDIAHTPDADATPDALFDFDIHDLAVSSEDTLLRKSRADSASSTSEPDEADGNADNRSHILDISDAISQIIEPLPSDVRATLDDLMPAELVECTYMEVQFLHPAAADLYDKQPQYADDAGWDLRFPEDVTIEARETKRLHLGLAVACYADSEHLAPAACTMIPRSSIVNTPLRMANSIGLIDAGYRGELLAVVDNCSDEPYEVKRGSRLFQLVGRSLLPFQWGAVEQLPDTERGEEGFGSTGV